jgi:Fe2+ or Zn2+ uptake regulation protein
MQNTEQTILFEARLRENGLSLTAPRRAVFEVLNSSHNPLTIQEIVKQIDGVHYVSIYRTIDALSKHGLIKQVPIGFKNKFELSDDFKPHHHHATCEKCGVSVSIANPSIEQIMNRLTIDAGLKPTRHHFEVYGLCQKCQS